MLWNNETSGWENLVRFDLYRFGSACELVDFPIQSMFTLLHSAYVRSAIRNDGDVNTHVPMAAERFCGLFLVILSDGFASRINWRGSLVGGYSLATFSRKGGGSTSRALHLECERSSDLSKTLDGALSVPQRSRKVNKGLVIALSCQR